jgi:hypothetical protein
MALFDTMRHHIGKKKVLQGYPDWFRILFVDWLINSELTYYVLTNPILLLKNRLPVYFL